MIRVLSILAAVAALAVSAAPVASAGTSKKPPSPTFIEVGTTETLDMNARDTAKGRSVGTVANLGAANEELRFKLACVIEYDTGD